MNAKVSVFGVEFATVWAGRDHLQEAKLSLNPLLLEPEQWRTHGMNRCRTGSRLPVNLAYTESYQSDNESSASGALRPSGLYGQYIDGR